MSYSLGDWSDKLALNPDLIEEIMDFLNGHDGVIDFDKAAEEAAEDAMEDWYWEHYLGIDQGPNAPDS